MKILLATDLHLDDNPDNEYRWKIFQHIKDAIFEHSIGRVYLLGDVPDRKDRFSSVFVNRLIHEINDVVDTLGTSFNERHESFSTQSLVTWLRGNHDLPLKGPAFFEFVNKLLSQVQYVTTPCWHDDLLLLPFAANPMEDWKGLPFEKAKCAFIHQTVTGAISENGTTLQGTKLPLLPRSLKIYSGDVHVQQTIKNVTYVGCPHPVKFGDQFPCRMLVLNTNDYSIVKQIDLDPPKKMVAAVRTLEDLEKLKVKAGDQVRLVVDLETAALDDWSKIQANISAWAEKRGVKVDGAEVVIHQPASPQSFNTDLAPELILREFADTEETPDDLFDIGKSILQEVVTQ